MQQVKVRNYLRKLRKRGNMSKPEDDNKNNAWSIFEAWGGRSWFPPVTEKKEKEDVGSIQRDNNLNGKRK